LESNDVWTLWAYVAFVVSQVQCIPAVYAEDWFAEIVLISSITYAMYVKLGKNREY